MSFETALRLTELLLALAVLQQALEHLTGPFLWDRLLAAARAVLAIALISLPWPGLCSVALLLHHLVLLHRYDGPYNGGADRMILLVTIGLAAGHLAPGHWGGELALAYLAAQLTLSYFMSGLVKVLNPDWRSGRALADVFLFSTYPVSEQLRGLAARSHLLWVGSWGVILFELAFPVGLLHPLALFGALVIAFGFHLANACLFGLNRFVWAWAAAYPSLIWLQARLV